MTPPTAVADVDLDLHDERDGPRGGDPVQPGRTPRPLPALVALVAVLGLLAGAAVRASIPSSPPPPAPVVDATVGLRSVVLDPGPTALLDVTVVNVHRTQVTVREVAVRAGGGPAVTVAVGRVLQPQQVTVIPARLRVACPPEGGPGAALGVDVLAVADARTAPVAATPVGAAARGAGVCGTGDATLPPGWRSPVPATLTRVDAAGAHLRVAGLPEGAVVGVRAGGWLTGDAARAVPLADGVELVLPGAAVACAPVGEAVPGALTVLLRRDTGRDLPVLAVAGPGLSSWVLGVAAGRCPQVAPRR